MTNAPTSLESVLLESESSRVLVAPTRGGIITRFMVEDRPVLYLDESTLVDPSKNVRGGNPVLFPSPGRLEADRWARGGHAGTMRQHGFARNEEWTVATRSNDDVTLRLVASDATKAIFPWDFESTLRYTLRGRTLRIDLRVETQGADVPFGAGFHPYFFVPESTKAAVRVPTKATRAWDNVQKVDVAVDGPVDLTKQEVDLRLLDHGSTMATLELGGGRAIHVRASDAFRHWVIWTLAGRDFVCLEPWTSPPNALNTSTDLLFAKRGAPVSLWVEIDASTD